MWEYATLDIAFVLLLLGGALILRARCASAVTWTLFGALSTGVGGFLFYLSYTAESVVAAPTAEALLSGAC